MNAAFQPPLQAVLDREAIRELRGDVAAAESYFLAFQEGLARDDRPAEETLLCGHVDRFERRGDEWRIAWRTVVYDWQRRAPLPARLSAGAFGARQPTTGGRRPNDPIYELLGALEAQGATGRSLHTIAASRRCT